MTSNARERFEIREQCHTQVILKGQRKFLSEIMAVFVDQFQVSLWLVHSKYFTATVDCAY